jgi:two-component system sensor histidine kinase AtoS
MLKRIPIFFRLSAAFVVIIVAVLVVLNYANVVSGGGTEGTGLRTAVAIVVAVILGCAATWFLVRRYLTRPMQGLVHGMNELAEKRFDFRLDENESDEFGSLAASFNDMASMLSSSLLELKKNQDYLRSILESSADIIITLNPSAKIQTINAGAEKALGYLRFDVIGEPIEKVLVNPADREVVVKRLRYADDVVNYESQFRTQTGAVRDVLLTISRLRNPQGEMIGTIVIGKDVTEEKRLQKQLIQSQRLATIGQVFTGIQHSMKNMLNACKGGAYMVRTGLASDNRDMLVQGWDMVQEGIERMTGMSSDMLKYVKDWKVRPDLVNVGGILEEIHRSIAQTAKDKGVTYRLDIAPDAPATQCDSKMIHSALMDIASNALDACLWKVYDEDEQPEVIMRAFADKKEQNLIIEIRDNGCGMTEDVKANIFTPFFSTKSKAGTGLGLSLTTRMIGAHGGEIDVESEPNRGALFRITLPVDGTTKYKEDSHGKEGTRS